jgi:hypothetical protein
VNLNLKKGLIRLFLVGLVISAIVGFFKVDSDQLVSSNRFYFESIASIEKEIKDPRCLALLKANNQNTDPVLLKYEGPCYHIGLFWDRVEDKRKSKDQEITGQFVIDVVDGRRSSQHLQYILVNTGLYVAGYLLICFVAWLVFISLWWIKRGFTS